MDIPLNVLLLLAIGFHGYVFFFVLQLLTGYLGYLTYKGEMDVDITRVHHPDDQELSGRLLILW